MKELVKEVMKFEGVTGALMFDARGEILCQDRIRGRFEDPQAAPWWPPFVESLEGLRGLELVYSGGAAYIRSFGDDYLLVLTDSAAPMAMIRLNCDVLLHGQGKPAARQKPRGFFRRRG